MRVQQPAGDHRNAPGAFRGRGGRPANSAAQVPSSALGGGGSGDVSGGPQIADQVQDRGGCPLGSVGQQGAHPRREGDEREPVGGGQEPGRGIEIDRRARAGVVVQRMGPRGHTHTVA